MSQLPLLFVVQLVARVTCLKLSSSDVEVNAPPGSTMAYDGKDWFFKVPDNDDTMGYRLPAPKKKHKKHHPWVHRWHASPDCNIHPPGKGHSLSQSYEDIDLYNAFFCNKTGGTFVELGALNGVLYSNTKFFENSLGWSGLLIEASPTSSADLRRNRGNPRNLILAEGVCPDGQGTMPFLVDGNPAVSGNPDTMSDAFHHKWHNGEEKRIDVPCRSLSTQLKEFILHSGADHIDFFSLDVEGGELAVLRTFNFDVPVRHWVIELDGSDPEKDDGVRKLLSQHGYSKVDSNLHNFSDRNEVWVIP